MAAGGHARSPAALAAGLVLTAILTALTPESHAADWARIAAAVGRESDVALSAGPSPAVVPGGPFLALMGSGGRRLAGQGGRRLDLHGQLWFERFTDADDRALFSAALGAEGLLPVGGPLFLRLGGGGRYFDDTARPGIRRLAAWTEAGIVLAAGRWRLDAHGGIEGRRYPRLDDTWTTGGDAVYTETQVTAGLLAEMHVGRRLGLQAAGHWRRTEAADVRYDDEGPTLEARAEYRLGRGWTLAADAYLQERTFTGRPSGDGDRYRQAAVGLEWVPAAQWIIGLRGILARYNWPDGSAVDTDRWQLTATLRLGGGAGAALPRPGALRGGADEGRRAGRPFTLKIHAPGAGAVALVGEFNGWDPQATPLLPREGGWWQTTCTLPAGTWAYAFVVDGAWVTPPDAEATEDDGFGGRNGLLIVLP